MPKKPATDGGLHPQHVSEEERKPGSYTAAPSPVPPRCGHHGFRGTALLTLPRHVVAAVYNLLEHRARHRQHRDVNTQFCTQWRAFAVVQRKPNLCHERPRKPRDALQRGVDSDDVDKRNEGMRLNRYVFRPRSHSYHECPRKPAAGTQRSANTLVRV